MEDPWEAPLSWEEFFGGSGASDLVSNLLHIYDAALAGEERKADIAAAAAAAAAAPPVRPSVPPPPPPPMMRGPAANTAPGKPTRPLSAASTCSSSSSSGENCAPSTASYLASTESLEAASSDEEDSESSQCLAARRRERLGQALREGQALLNRQSGSSAGSADSGVGGCTLIISAPQPPPVRPRYCSEPHLSPVERVLLEITETEAVYVRDLEEVVEGYLYNWRESAECPVAPQQLADLFSNMELILGFNRGFLRDLDACNLDAVKVAQCFVTHNSGFRIYTEYCTSYPKTVSVLTELMQNEETVSLCRERQAALHHSLPLGSYLLKPVQRVLKYHLLLQSLMKQFPAEAAGRSAVEEALEAMTGLAQHINEMKRRHEHAVRVQEIQSLLHDWQGADLTTFGELCAEGNFRICGAKALRHAFLFDKMLLIAKRTGDHLTCKTHIECSNLMLIESIPGEPLNFHVIPFDNPRMQYTFQARSLEQKREWTQQLKRVILENYSVAIPNHARQLVMQLGQGRTEDELLAERSVPRRQHSAPQYLQKRHQERRRSETGLLPSRLRRSRRSDVGVANQEGGSPRNKRSSSASRDPEGCSSVSPGGGVGSGAEKLKDRFYNWHRKSEPYCSLTLPSKLSQLFSSLERRNSTCRQLDRPTQPCNETSCSEQQEHEEEEEEEEEEEREAPAGTSNRQASLEEIVGEIVMQNVRSVKRSRSLGRPRDPLVSAAAPTADSSSDCEQKSPRQQHRAQRLARMCALRTQQETLQQAGGLSRQMSFLQQWQQRQHQHRQEDKPRVPPPPPPTSLQVEEAVAETPTRSVSSTSLSSPGVGGGGKRSPGTPTRSPSFLGVLASFGSRLMANSCESLTESPPPPPPGAAEQPKPPMLKQGSRGLGARIAMNTVSDYADPATLGIGATRGAAEDDDDSFYEDNLSAVLDQEEFYRDSAIFSDDHDEPVATATTPAPPRKVPPPVPAKPPRLLIAKPPAPSECGAPAETQPKPKGWVKQMVGRIQAGAES
ncbi:uncharacterized protein LOC135942550 isoform X2 [Cloeon dipterum]|uniref:uncharacterized protein LOC135942550 isoform X2 n=1 Tax=Cloeon dipterum TaxID=197152 RepID=UPI00321FA391